MPDETPRPSEDPASSPPSATDPTPPLSESDSTSIDRELRAAIGERPGDDSPTPPSESAAAPTKEPAASLESEIAAALAGVDLMALANESTPATGTRINLEGGRRTRTGQIVSIRNRRSTRRIRPEEARRLPAFTVQDAADGRLHRGVPRRTTRLGRALRPQRSGRGAEGRLGQPRRRPDRRGQCDRREQGRPRGGSRPPHRVHARRPDRHSPHPRHLDHAQRAGHLPRHPTRQAQGKTGPQPPSRSSKRSGPRTASRSSPPSSPANARPSWSPASSPTGSSPISAESTA